MNSPIQKAQVAKAPAVGVSRRLASLSHLDDSDGCEFRRHAPVDFHLAAGLPISWAPTSDALILGSWVITKGMLEVFHLECAPHQPP